MRKTTLILAFLAVVVCAQAQSEDSVLRRNFETETDSILYEMSVAEGAQDVYRVEDAEHYDDYNKTPYKLKKYFYTVPEIRIFVFLHRW